MNWINTSDKLPEEGKAVLIYFNEGLSEDTMCVASWDGFWNVKGKEINQVSHRVSVASWDGFWNAKGSHGYESENTFNDEDVTHWMELPEPPIDG